MKNDMTLLEIMHYIQSLLKYSEKDISKYENGSKVSAANLRKLFIEISMVTKDANKLMRSPNELQRIERNVKINELIG